MISEAYLRLWFAAFLFTQLVEVPVYRWALGRYGTRGPHPFTRTVLAFAPSTLTHPVVWFVFPAHWPPAWGDYAGMVAGAEAFAVLAEALFLYALPCPRLPRLSPMLSALALSLLANGLSYGLGELCRASFGVP